ncbi:hypothetical protein Tco_1250234, partial [Tanacetum coccineum]
FLLGINCFTLSGLGPRLDKAVAPPSTRAVSALGVRGEGLSAGEMLFETYPTQWKLI